MLLQGRRPALPRGQSDTVRLGVSARLFLSKNERGKLTPLPVIIAVAMMADRKSCTHVRGCLCLCAVIVKMFASCASAVVKPSRWMMVMAMALYLTIIFPRLSSGSSGKSIKNNSSTSCELAMRSDSKLKKSAEHCRSQAKKYKAMSNGLIVINNLHCYS